MVTEGNGKKEMETKTIERRNPEPNKFTVYCYYCESHVQHFPRHIIRNHKSELEVQKLLSLPARSQERKQLLCSLRKKGNYLVSNEAIKPVRKGIMNTNHLPCTFCLGFYSSKNLWRHKKQCSENPAKGKSQANAQADAQNFLLRHLRVDVQLQSDVFPRMRPDQISLTAKKDPLICAFGARYLKIHREKHFIAVTSRKMRELARLLIEARKLNTSIKDLFSALKGEHYDVLVSATKIVSKYDTEARRYDTPTYALNMGTTLKQCCDIALQHALKKSNLFHSITGANVEVDIRSLVQLIEGNWRFDISSQACSDLNMKKWNKVSLVPLACDLKLLKQYLIETSNKAVAELTKTNTDKNAYITLLETIYCRLLLLNRRRPGELQRLFVDTYLSCLVSKNSQGYEEFSEAISEAEKILMSSFKRIVIKGKRGRGVPVLFSEDLQEHLKLVLASRDLINRHPNKYLFGNPNSEEPIIGY